MQACQGPQATVRDADVDSAATFLGYLYIVSQYTVRLTTPCVWRIFYLRNSSSVVCTLVLATTEFINCITPKPKVHRMWYDCFRPKLNVCRKCPFVHIRRGKPKPKPKFGRPLTLTDWHYLKLWLGLQGGSTIDGHKPRRPKTLLGEICPTMSNEFNYSEQSVYLTRKLRGWTSLHRVPAQSVGLKTDHKRTLQRILTHFIFDINVRNNGPPEQPCFQRTP